MIAAGVAAAAASTPAAAYEFGYGGISIGSGAFLNAPATSPPPGLYGSLIFNQGGFTFRGPGTPFINGRPTQFNISDPILLLTYFPGFNILGGVYSFTVAQQESFVALSAPINANRSGLHNSNITPISLGYRLAEGLFTKINLSFVVPDGTRTGATGLGNIGTPFTTILPRLTTTYQANGFTLNNNFAAEFDTTNPITGYRDGVKIRDEATLTKTFGRVTIGPAFAYVAQVSNDSSSKFYNFAINVNRFTSVEAGGIIGYDFGPVSLAVFGLNQITTTASGGTPTRPGGPDSALFIGGYQVYAQLNFKIPGFSSYDKGIDFSALRTAAPR